MRDGLLIALPLMAAPSPAMANPQDFPSKALMGDSSQMVLGRMAAAHATMPALRQYGAMLISDHAKA